MSSKPEYKTAHSQTPPSTETFEASTGHPTVAEPMSSAGDSHVNLSQWLESAERILINATCGPRLPDAFARLSPYTCSWKTCQGCLVGLTGISDTYSASWPASGSMLNGRVYRRPRLEPRINAIDCGYSLPTPVASTYGSNKGGAAGRVGKERLSLQSMATRNEWPEGMARCDITGPLSPMWTEWLMAWPVGASDLKPLETERFQAWLRSHSWVCLREAYRPSADK